MAENGMFSSIGDRVPLSQKVADKIEEAIKILITQGILVDGGWMGR